MIKHKQRLFLFLMLLFLFPTPTYTQTLPTELLFLDDTLLTLKTPPRLIDDQLYVHLRSIAPFLNLDIHYDSSTHFLSLTTTTTSFDYSFENTQAFLNDELLTLEAHPIILEDTTWVPIIPFAKYFGYEADLNHSLLIIDCIGTKELYLPSMLEPITYPIYNYIPVSSVFIDKIIPAETFIDGTYSVLINDASIKQNTLYLTITPYTLVNYPKDYDLVSDPRLFNFSSTTLTLPVSLESTYTYLTYIPTTFSYETTYDSMQIYKDASSGILNLASMEIVDGIIYHITQIFRP